MDIAYNKVDQTALPIDPTRVSASEYNQIAASLMNIITSAGLTPDSQDNAQLLNALGPRIVETYSNGTSWYRVYSDGWCEQGGMSNLTYVTRAYTDITITLLKEMANTNYAIVLSTSDRGNVHLSNWVYSTINTTDFVTRTYSDGASTGTGFWRVSGYIA